MEWLWHILSAHSLRQGPVNFQIGPSAPKTRIQDYLLSSICQEGTPYVVQVPSPKVQQVSSSRFNDVFLCKILEAATHSDQRYAVTAAVFESIRAGIAACCVLSRSAGASIHLVDVGMASPSVDADPAASQPTDVHSSAEEQKQHNAKYSTQHPRTIEAGARSDIMVERARICQGSHDMVTEAAMLDWELEAALRTGSEAAARAQEEGVKVLCIGEIGIGNTTAAAALLSALTGASAEDVTGRGTGVDDTGLGHKRTAVMSAVQRAKGSCKHSLKVPDSSAENSGACKNYEYARAMLQEVGGIEIAAMAGAFMHAKKTDMTVVVDGFISGVAALAAVMIDPDTASALLLSHHSNEKGAEVLLDALQQHGVLLKAPLNMDMRLGEGSGALLCLPLLTAACNIMNDMGTLADALALVGMGAKDGE